MSFGSFVLLPNITGHFTNGWELCTVAVINPTGAFYTTISTRNQANPEPGAA